MRIKRLALEGAAEIETKQMSDDRGWFARFFCQEELTEINSGQRIQQANCSFTRRRGTIRGLHFQYPPYAEDKAVRCIAGSIFDVMVDLRRGSPTFGHHHAVVLDAAQHNMVYVPKGFAHGFQTLEDNAQVLYLHTAFHAPDAEGGLHYNSPDLGIEWPLEVIDMSVRDKGFSQFDVAFGGLQL